MGIKIIFYFLVVTILSEANTFYWKVRTPDGLNKFVPKNLVYEVDAQMLLELYTEMRQHLHRFQRLFGGNLFNSQILCFDCYFNRPYGVGTSLLGVLGVKRLKKFISAASEVTGQTSSSSTAARECLEHLGKFACPSVECVQRFLKYLSTIKNDGSGDVLEVVVEEEEEEEEKEEIVYESLQEMLSCDRVQQVESCVSKYSRTGKFVPLNDNYDTYVIYFSFFILLLFL